MAYMVSGSSTNSLFCLAFLHIWFDTTLQTLNLHPGMLPIEDAAAFQNKMDGYQFPNSGSAKASVQQLRCVSLDAKKPAQ